MLLYIGDITKMLLNLHKILLLEVFNFVKLSCIYSNACYLNLEAGKLQPRKSCHSWIKWSLSSLVCGDWWLSRVPAPPRKDLQCVRGQMRAGSWRSVRRCRASDAKYVDRGETVRLVWRQEQQKSLCLCWYAPRWSWYQPPSLSLSLSLSLAWSLAVSLPHNSIVYIYRGSGPCCLLFNSCVCECACLWCLASKGS